MNKNGYGPYSLPIIAIAMIAFTPAFAEVTDLQTNSKSFFKDESITFDGQVEPNSSGLVTIVIRDSNDQFVMLTQAITDENYSFEKTIKINEKFTDNGIYNATGFILNMTAGVTTSFGVSTNGHPLIVDEDLTIPEPPIEDLTIPEPPIKRINFVDPSKDPQYYLDRYYNEPGYKSWFDRNYPEFTIEEAVGYDNQDPKTTVEQFMENEILPEAEAASIVQSNPQPENNTENAQIVLAVGGLGLLFAAVYGIKRKVDNNSKQISINKHLIRKKLINPFIGSTTSDILQTRLAKGEISLEEFDILEKKLNKKY